MIHWQCHSPSPYNSVLFDSIARQHPLVVHYRFGNSVAHPWSSISSGHQAVHWNGDVKKIAKSMHEFSRSSTDLVVFGSWVGLPVLACLGAALASGRRFVLWTDTPNQHTRRSWIKMAVRSSLCRFLFSRAYRVLGTGPMCLDRLSEMGCQPTKLMDLPYIVDPTAYGLAAMPRPGLPLRLCIVGRLSPEKGVLRAIQAVAVVRAAGHDIELSIIGSGPEEQLLRQATCTLEQGAAIRFLGWLQPGELRSELAGHHFLLHAADHEPYGVVVVEALCSGLPVIGTDTTAAVVHRVQDGVNGFIAPATVDGLVRALLQVVEKRDSWDELSMSARKEGAAWPPERAADLVLSLLP